MNRYTMMIDDDDGSSFCLNLFHPLMKMIDL